MKRFLSLIGEMKYIPLFFIITLCVITTSKAQEIDHHMEFGLGIGGINYTGDLTPRYSVKNFKPGAQFFYRYNLPNNVSVFRLNILAGGIGADESNYNDPLQNTRQLEFSGSLGEIAGIYEYNFFDYRDLKGTYFMAPYLFGGIGVTSVWGGGVPTFISIPFGVGVKYKLGDNFNLGLEYGARKIFTDKLDGYNDPEVLSSSRKSDWYYFLSLTLSYTIYQQLCPECSPKIGGRR